MKGKVPQTGATPPTPPEGRMGCSYFWWGCVELCFVSADERPRTVCGFALLVWLVWLLWLGMVCLVLRGLSCFLFLFWLEGCGPSPGSRTREKARYPSPLFSKLNGRGRVGVGHAASFVARGKFCGSHRVVRSAARSLLGCASHCWAGAAAAAAGCRAELMIYR